MTDPYDRYLDDFRARLGSASATLAERPRRRGLVVGTVGAIGALALALVLLLTGSPPGAPLDVVAAARAALSPRGEIVYLKIRTGGASGGRLTRTPSSGPLRTRPVGDWC